MSNRVLIEIVGQDQGLDEANAKLDTLSQKEKQILADMKALEQERNKAKFYAKTAQDMANAEQKFGKMVEDNVKRLKDVRKEQGNVKKSIEDLSNAQKAMPGKIIAENTAKSFRTLKREIDEQLRTWSDWSTAGTAAYNKLLAKAGEMNDTMGDTNRAIQYMGSDTKGFDTLVDGTQAVAGGFSVAQGAMALFGAENEDLQQLMVKLQSTIAISTGLQQIGNVVQKESNLMMGIGIAQKYALAKAESYERLMKIQGTSATIGATVAQRAFNLVAKANPYVLLAMAVVTVVGALLAFTMGSKKAEENTDSLADSQKELKGAFGETNEAIEYQARLFGASTGANSVDILKFKIKQYEQNIQNAKESLKQLEAQGKKDSYTYKTLQELQFRDEQQLSKLKQDLVVEEESVKTEARKKAYDKNKEQQQKDFQSEREYWTKINEIRIQAETDAQKKVQDLKNNKISIEEEDMPDVKDYTDILQHRYNMDLISYDDYLKKKRDYLIAAGKDTDAIDEEIYKNELAKLNAHEAKKREILQQSVQLMGEIGNIFFDYRKEKLSQEMSDLQHYYTTDIEEAKKNKDLKLISEKELAAKQLEIKRKQAQADKNQAIFNIGISTAMGIMSALGSIPPNPILAAFIGVTGAAQAIAVAAKPLPKYWKGRKGGKGELARVGEYGNELRYSPLNGFDFLENGFAWIGKNDSIMPAHETQRALNGDTKLFDKWNMPPIDRWIPMPDISQKVNNKINRKESMDYDLLASKIGEHVGRRVKIPKGKNVTVNVDNTGVTVEENNTRTRILNKKYNG